MKVDLPQKKFWAPWNKSWQPINAVDAREIVFVDHHIENGPDNSPASNVMKFDVLSGQLSYINAYGGVIYHNENFSARCKVAPHA